MLSKPFHSFPGVVFLTKTPKHISIFPIHILKGLPKAHQPGICVDSTGEFGESVGLAWLGKSDEFMGILDSTGLGMLNVMQNQDGTGPALQFAVHTEKKIQRY